MTRWQELGRLLISRRVELNPAWINRRTFCDDNNLSRQYRTISDIEKGRRTDYGPSVLALVESAYRLQTGSIRAFLDGGELTPSGELPEVKADPGGDAAREWIREHPIEAMREVMKVAMTDAEVREQLGI